MQIPGYNIIHKINSGGMASVYLATQLSVGRTVALKIMKPELDQDPEFHMRFKREAEIIGQLSHPNIIPIYDIGRYNGLNFISMEYLSGGSLDEKIITGLTANEVVDIVIAIANALEHAHSRGYVHRDIKPENILFRADNTAVLTDFGIAKTLKNDMQMTQAGNVIGTPYYMSPEQARGLNTDGRSDLYSLGILCYEMLTGTRPFRSETSLALAIQHIDEQPPKLPLQYFIYQLILDRLLAKKPENRFQNARDLITALDNIKNTSTTQLLPPSGGTNSFQLFKIISHTLAQDIQLLAGRTVFYYRQIVTKIKRKSDCKIPIISCESTTAIHNAETSIYSAAANIENPQYKQRTTIIIGIALLLIIFVSIHPFGQKKSAHREQWNNFFHSNSHNAGANNTQLTLTIMTQPENATVRVLNIGEKYVAGIELPTGEYHINIKAAGYESVDEWIKLSPDTQILHYALNKKLDKYKNDPTTIIIPTMVDVPNGNFLIGKYEVTFNEYDNFAVATHRSLPDDQKWGRGDHPVINVSWDDAQAYVNWLSKMTGSRYRLATSAEWEFAARGNTTSLFWWGDTVEDAHEYANCHFGCRSLWSNLFDNKTTPVGSYPPNGFGLHDTAGNVAEWVDDCYLDNNDAKASNTPVAQCKEKIIRGGSFRDNVKAISSQARSHLTANTHNDSTGFRIVKEFDEMKKTERELNRDESSNIFQRFINKLRQ